MSTDRIGVRMSQWMENMREQRGVTYAGNHNPMGRANEAGQFVRDKFREVYNVVLRSPV